MFAGDSSIFAESLDRDRPVSRGRNSWTYGPPVSVALKLLLAVVSKVIPSAFAAECYLLSPSIRPYEGAPCSKLLTFLLLSLVVVRLAGS